MLEGLSPPVAGPAVIFPRGYLWGVPLWAAAGLGYLATSHWVLWFRADLAAGLIVALLIFAATVGSLRFRAFSADRAGVRIGLPASSRRHGRKRRTVRQIPWQQIERVRIARRPFRVRIEVVLGPNATAAVRGHKPHPIVAAIHRVLLLMIPFWYLTRPTGLVSPLGKPARYKVMLRDTTVDEMRHSLRSLAPAEVAVTVLARRHTSVSSAKAAQEGLRQSA